MLINGEDVTSVPPAKRPTTTVFQDYALFPHMTVAGNVAFGLKMRRTPRSEQGRRVARTLDGGANWSVLRVPNDDEAQFRDVHAVSADEAERWAAQK